MPSVQSTPSPTPHPSWPWHHSQCSAPSRGFPWRTVRSSSAPGPLLFSHSLPLVTTVKCLSLAPGPWTRMVLMQEPIQLLYPDVSGISNLTCRGQKAWLSTVLPTEKKKSPILLQSSLLTKTHGNIMYPELNASTSISHSLLPKCASAHVCTHSPSPASFSSVTYRIGFSSYQSTAQDTSTLCLFYTAIWHFCLQSKSYY